MTIANLLERLVASTCDGAVGTLARWADATTVARRIREHALALLEEPTSVASASRRSLPGHTAGESVQPVATRSSTGATPGRELADGASAVRRDGGVAGPRDADRGDRAELVEWAENSFALVQPRSSAESRPFPHAIAWYRSRELRDCEDAMALREATMAHFADRGLVAVCIFRHGTAAPPEIVATPYKRWVAGAIRELVDAPPPRGYDRVRVRRPADLSFYPAYERMYEAFWEAEPRLGRRIGMEEPEQFLSHAADDGLRLVDVDGELGGVIGAFRHEEVGLRGWRIEERVMDERYRGQGLAAAALRRFVEDLPPAPQRETLENGVPENGAPENGAVDGGRRDAEFAAPTELTELVWGTILVQHAASLGSALRLGRVDIGGLWWLAEEDPIAGGLERSATAPGPA